MCVCVCGVSSGKVFTVTLEMMTRYPESFFGVLVSERWSGGKAHQADETFFINRSAKMFGHITDFLRGDVEGVQELSTSKKQKLLREAQYYQVSEQVNKRFFPMWMSSLCRCFAER